jgi:cytochrome c oxidase cbb3-type subunit I/II
MLNGLLTLRGAWDKVRDDATLKFMVVAVTAYGMATFEGPMLSIKSVNAISHFTDWTIAHVHVGALGWNGFLTFGMLYWMVLDSTALSSFQKLAVSFWISFSASWYGCCRVFRRGYAGLMWKQFTEGFHSIEPSRRCFRSFRCTSFARPAARFLTDVIGVYNLSKTMGQVADRGGSRAPRWRNAPHGRPVQAPGVGRKRICFGTGFGGGGDRRPGRNGADLLIKSNIPTITSVKPYTPLELEGARFMSPSAYNCHSQMVRRFAPKPNATASIRRRANTCTIIPSNGAQSGPARIFIAREANTPMPGTGIT